MAAKTNRSANQIGSRVGVSDPSRLGRAILGARWHLACRDEGQEHGTESVSFASHFHELSELGLPRCEAHHQRSRER